MAPSVGVLRALSVRSATVLTISIIVSAHANQCDDDVPGAVEGSTIYFDGVGPTSVTLHWQAPCVGKYGADILGYGIEYKKVCKSPEPHVATVSPPAVHVEPIVEGAEIALTKIPGTDVITAVAGTLVAFGPGSVVHVVQKSGQNNLCGASGTYTIKSTSDTTLTLGSAIGRAGTETTCALKQQLSGLSDAQALNMRATTITGVGSRTATVETTGVGLSAYGYGLSSWSRYDRVDAIDTVPGGVTDCPGAMWAVLPGVYTPSNGQNYEGECKEICKATACRNIGDASDAGLAHIMATCSGCFAADLVKPGCFPGSLGFPTAPLTRHTSRGLAKNTLYVFRLRAHNSFGTRCAFISTAADTAYAFR